MLPAVVVDVATFPAGSLGVDVTQTLLQVPVEALLRLLRMLLDENALRMNYSTLSFIILSYGCSI